MPTEGLNLSCPGCGATTITVSAVVWVMVDRDHEHDTGVGSGYSYGDESPAVCRSCGHRARLMEFDPEGRDEACECATALVPGTLYVPDIGNVERCDLCQQFPGDLEAAIAVSEKVGKAAWALMEHPNGHFQIERVTARMADDDVHWVAEGTDPWIGEWQEGLDFDRDDIWPTAAAEQAWRTPVEERSDEVSALAEEFGDWADRNEYDGRAASPERAGGV